VLDDLAVAQWTEATKEEATVQVCGTASPQWQGPIARLGYGWALCKAKAAPGKLLSDPPCFRGGGKFLPLN